MCLSIKLKVIKPRKNKVSKQFKFVYSTNNTMKYARVESGTASEKTGSSDQKAQKTVYNKEIIFDITENQLVGVLGIENYDCSDDWIKRFQNSHYINLEEV